MNKPHVFILLLLFLLQANTLLFSQEDLSAGPKSVSVVLSVTGDGHTINKIQPVLVKVYDGKAKSFNEINSTRTSDVLIMRAYNLKGEEVFTGYYDNPLVENKEIYTEDGQHADNFLFVTKEGSINVRFPIPGNVGSNLLLKCYQQLEGQPEKLLTTLSLNQ
ncbi:MAG TPA: hypothetical protein PLS10_09785 [Chitinophagales bacterium]|nr:hypothetical protein [Chitinophagales bacterium]HRH57933.1 hypothetical protein [Chitinophagales bacterium]